MICIYIDEMPLIFYNITLQVGMDCIKSAEEETEGEQLMLIGLAVGGFLLLLLSSRCPLCNLFPLISSPSLLFSFATEDGHDTLTENSVK